MRESLVLLVFTLIFHSATAQKQDSVFAENLVAEATSLRKNDKPEEASARLRQAREIFKKNNFCWRALFAASRLAMIEANEKKQPFAALDSMDKGVLELNCPVLDSAAADNYCFHVLDAAFMAKEFANDFVRMKEYLLTAYRVFHEKLSGKQDRIAKFLFFQLGNAYVRLSEYEAAKRIFQEGIEYARQNNAPQVAKFSDFGDLFITTGEYSKALEIYREGLLFKGISSTDSIALRLSEAECLVRLEKFQEAIAANKIAKKLIAKLPTDHPALGFFQSGLFGNYGLAFSGLKNFKLADNWFQKAIKTAQNYHGNKQRRRQAFFQLDLADNYLKWGKLPVALQTFQTAMKTLQPSISENSSENPTPENLFGDKVFLQALEGKATVFEKTNQLEKALACFELIPIVEEKLRFTHSYESSSLLSLRESRGRFERAVDLAWQLFEQSGGNLSFAKRAFYLTEQARGALLLQSLARARADLENTLPSSERQKLREIRAKSSWLELRIAEENEANSEPKLIQNLENELFKLKQDQSVFETQLKKDFPGWAASQNRIEFVEAEKVKNLLRPGQAMFSYFLTENFVHIFCLQKNGQLDWRRENLPADFRNRTRDFCEYLTRADAENAGMENFKNTSTELARLLLAPEIQKLTDEKSLVIVPDDVLVFLPFEVLILENELPAKPQWRAFNYLIKRFSVNYAYSATLLAMQQSITAERKRAPKYLAGFAPKYNFQQDTAVKKALAFRARGGEYDLLGTHIEVKKINEIFSAADIFENADATELHFKNIANQYQILHFAMHAVANETSPELSRLLFGDKIKTDSANDNILYANELQMMRLQAGLAVLSACHTGFGKINRGEGVYSLARAFTAAGVPATVMSLWRLPDNTAPVIMENFYRHLAEGLPKDEALRLAKIQFLETKEMYPFTQPYFWAGITANGDACPMPPPSRFWWWAAGVAGLATLLFWFFRRLKNRKK